MDAEQVDSHRIDHAPRYAMQVGIAGAERLALLDTVYEAGTRGVLTRAELRPGMTVVDLGCGTGAVACSLAEQVGRSGRVVGIDVSAQQVAHARARARDRSLENVEFVIADVSHTGLPRSSIDLAYCRATLMHLARPEEAIREMRELLRPGGVLVCEEPALDTSATEPTSEAHRRLQAMSCEMFARRGCDWQVAQKLYRLVLDAGFRSPDVTYYQPVFVRGEGKQFEELSFREVRDRIVAAGIASADEVDVVADAIRDLVLDESIVYSLSRMTQVWAKK